MADGTSKRGPQPPPATKAVRPEGRARHVHYSKRLGREICARVAGGESLRALSKLDGFPCYSTFLRWKARYPEFAEALARAEDRCAGKPMSAKDLQASARQMSDLALETLAKIMEGDGQDSTRLAAAREVLDRAHGKPKPPAKPKPKTPKSEGMTVIVKRYSDVTPQDEAEHDATQALFE
jgi:hypothetical protein